MRKKALIVGASGIIGTALSARLIADGWAVQGVSRGRTPLVAGCEPIRADVTSAQEAAQALRDVDADKVFFTAWARQATESENIRVNGAMVHNVLNAMGARLNGGHVALVTGLKHYLGPFEAYGQGNVPETPFRETQGRQQVENFYYEQEDQMYDAAGRFAFSWSVHRPHTIIGMAPGNAMNMGTTLAVYASLCKETGAPFVFPGSKTQWDSLTDMTDAKLLASHLEWAATHDAGKNQDFNVVNGDVFRWKWMWQQIANYFGIEAAPFDGETRPLEGRMPDAAMQWRALAQKAGLKEADIGHLASWWHTDADLGRPMEIVTDMSKSRKAGFLIYQDTLDAFIDLFEQLKRERIIPA